MKKEHKVKYGYAAISRIELKQPAGFSNIGIGDPFHLVDAYKQGNGIFIGINRGGVITGSRFQINSSDKIHSRMDIKKFVSTFITKVRDGFEYIICDDGILEVATIQEGTKIDLSDFAK